MASTYRLPRRRAEAPAERPAEAEVPAGGESPDAVSCQDHPCIHGLTPTVLSSLSTPSRSNPASVDSLPFSQSPPSASPGASMLSDDETEEEAELRREQEQEQARRLYAANGSSLAALDPRAAGEEAARKAEQMAMLSLLKKNNLLDTLQPRSEAEAEQRFEQLSGLAMFRSRAGDLCRDARLDMPDTAELQRRERIAAKLSSRRAMSAAILDSKHKAPVLWSPSASSMFKHESPASAAGDLALCKGNSPPCSIFAGIYVPNTADACTGASADRSPYSAPYSALNSPLALECTRGFEGVVGAGVGGPYEDESKETRSEGASSSTNFTTKGQHRRKETPASPLGNLRTQSKVLWSPDGPVYVGDHGAAGVPRAQWGVGASQMHAGQRNGPRLGFISRRASST